MWHLGTWLNVGPGSAGLIVVLSGLKKLSNLYGSMNYVRNKQESQSGTQGRKETLRAKVLQSTHLKVHLSEITHKVWVTANTNQGYLC